MNNDNNPKDSNNKNGENKSNRNGFIAAIIATLLIFVFIIWIDFSAMRCGKCENHF